MTDPLIETVAVPQLDGTVLYAPTREARQLRAETQARAYFSVIETLTDFGAYCAERWPGPCLLVGAGIWALYRFLDPPHTRRKRRRQR